MPNLMYFIKIKPMNSKYLIYGNPSDFFKFKIEYH